MPVALLSFFSRNVSTMIERKGFLKFRLEYYQSIYWVAIFITWKIFFRDIPFSEQIARLQQTFYCGFMEITDPPTKSDLFWKVCFCTKLLKIVLLGFKYR